MNKSAQCQKDKTFFGKAYQPVHLKGKINIQVLRAIMKSTLI